MEVFELFLAALALAAGGVLKGAIGAGAPLLAVPLLALLHDVPFAVAILVVPNIVSNGWQAWAYRAHIVSRRMGWSLAIGGATGACLGSVLLAKLSGDLLLAGLASLVFLYIGLHLARPEWRMGRAFAERIAGPVAVLGGILQGAGGISAPVSITFLHAMRLERLEFMATISVFFGAMGLAQLPTLFAFEILTPSLTVLSCLAAVPLFGAMPLGAALGQRIRREIFDSIILWLLAVIALKLLFNAFA